MAVRVVFMLQVSMMVRIMSVVLKARQSVMVMTMVLMVLMVIVVVTVMVLVMTLYTFALDTHSYSIRIMRDGFCPELSTLKLEKLQQGSTDPHRTDSSARSYLQTNCHAITSYRSALPCCVGRASCLVRESSLSIVSTFSAVTNPISLITKGCSDSWFVRRYWPYDAREDPLSGLSPTQARSLPLGVFLMGLRSGPACRAS